MTITIDIPIGDIIRELPQELPAPSKKTEIIRPRIDFSEIGKANVGDYFITELKSGEKVRFDCVDRADGLVRFDSHDCVLSSQWNKEDTNTGGYFNSLLRQNVDAFIEELPEELQELIVEVPRRNYSGEFFKETGVYETKTKLFIPDEGELFDDDELYNERIYDQLDWYKDRRNRMKGASFGGDTAWYWTASAGSGTSTYVVAVTASGRSDNSGASSAYRVPVCFQVNAV